MPIEEHRKVVKSAHRAGLSEKRNPKRFNAYVYSTLNKIKKARAAKRKRRRGKKGKKKWIWAR